MPTYVDIGLAVAEADPSMGWITTFYMEHNWLLTMFAEELQDEIFGAQPFVLAPGSVNPSGRATSPPATAPTRCRATGPFGTGICHADWVLVSGKIEGDEIGRGPQLPAARRRRRGEGHLARRRHGRDRQPRHRGHRRRRARAPGVADAAAARASPSRATPTCTGSRSRRSSRSPRRCRRWAPPSERSSCSRSRLFDRVMFGTKRTQSARVPTQVRLANLRVEVDFAETLMRDVADRMQAHADGRIDLDLLGQQHLRLGIAHIVRRAATSCARSCSRAARRCTTSTTSCSASTATST